MVAQMVRAMGAPQWLVLFAAIGGAWALLFAMSLPADLRALQDVYGLEALRALCVVTPDAAGFVRTFAMWALMSLAMMAPTVLPALATYDDLGHATRAPLAPLVAGYLAVWLGFSALAAGTQLALVEAAWMTPFGQSASLWLSAALLVGAGLYQFSTLKEACLSKCRAPLTFFMSHWDNGPWRMGLRLGAVCLGCCWALMALAFVGGTASLTFMGLATLLMIFEKLPEIGRYLTRPLGGALIGAGVVVALMAL